MTLFKKTIVAASISLSILGSQAIAAGNVNGTIDGSILGHNGAEITDATIIIENEKNGFKRTISTGVNGDFRVNLPSGAYKVTVQKRGYQPTVIEKVLVSIGSSASLDIPLSLGDLEEVVVFGEVAPQIRRGTAESSLNIGLADIEMLPVSRNIESVALLAPGTVLGDSGFGEDKDLISFGGASVGENAYYIDGLNVTNFRNGLGGSSVPFEFYDQFQIKTGGYSAEFGRSLGGVLNAVTKRGGNEFEYGVVAYYEPADLRSTSPNTISTDGTLYDLNSENEKSRYTTDYYVSGPIVPDKLFFYALYEQQETIEEFTTRADPGTFNDREIGDDFWGVNLTWNITDNHIFSYVHFSDERTRENRQLNYDPYNKDDQGYKGTVWDERGGENWLVRYDGQITDNFSVSLLHGENEYSLTTTSTTDTECPYVVDTSDGAIPGNSSTFPGCEASARPQTGGDERVADRIDFEWVLGDHTLRFGYDQENNSSSSAETYSGTGLRADGGVYYRYYTFTPGAELSNGGIVPDIHGDGSDVHIVRYRLGEVSGDFEVESKAFYIEDTWDITDTLTISAGLRNETFSNYNGEGDVFIEIDDQWAPRLSFSWDPFGDGESRLFGNWGRYFMPIASNTNVRLSGGELGIQRYFIFDGDYDPVTVAPSNVGTDGIPLSEEIGSTQITSSGEVPDSAQLSDRDLEPMYQDEIIFGYEKVLNSDWTVGLKATYRDLKSHIDDVSIDHAVDALGYEHTGDAHGYVLANPGNDITIPYDRYGTGELEMTTFPAELLAYPEAKRKYKELEVSTKRGFDGVWGISASYTWSESKGNTEGYVKSDNAQDDAGITQDFDFPELMDGADGFLPNDRTHKFKIYGNYQIMESLLLGVNLLWQSGRPINSFGAGHPNGTPSYGDTYYLTDSDGNLIKAERGSSGRTGWVKQIDLSLVYTTRIGLADLELRAEIFNLLDADAETEVYEFAELSPGIADPNWGINQVYQTPRYLRFGASARF
ncbi:TonB-dependent receptor domain-containing protein [Microbulbifer sp. ANSA001]|uniref:TonB-dependent receptor n=1 Tax=Microbulbifer TaxID=48073 RepID=UPI00036BF601|nr:TonB-dependent receptor [Microbulbifer variabilis]